MIDASYVLIAAALLGGVGLWLMLPRGQARGRAAGAVVGAASLGMFASLLPSLGGWLPTTVFYVLAAVTLGSAVATVTFRSPVYCAIWFGLTLAGTAGLFLFQGAQFLAVATVVVYAGAILVTFLFVLMLAQPTGRAGYDRASWEALASSLCGAALVGLLTWTFFSVLAAGRFEPPATADYAQRRQEVLAGEHMQRFSHALFSRHLAAVEAAGALLLAALVGASVIVGRSRGPLVGPPPGPNARPVDRPTAPLAPGENGHG